MLNYFYTVLISFGVMFAGLFGYDQVAKHGETVTLGTEPRVYITDQGGTGTSSPSGILYGDNDATNSLKTVVIGSNLTFSNGTLSSTGGSGSSYFGDLQDVATSSDATGDIYYLNSSGQITNLGVAADGTVLKLSGGLPSWGVDATGGGSGTVSTSTNETAGNLSYWTSNSATPALLGQVGTTTLTASSPLSLSNPVAKVGGSNSVLTIDTSGAWTGSAGDLNCTDCINATEIEDIYVLLAGDSSSGAYNWSGVHTFSASPIAQYIGSTGSASTINFWNNLGNTSLGITYNGSNEDSYAITLPAASGVVALTSQLTNGTVTNIGTTWPITGGPITTTGTLAFNGLSTSSAAVVGNIPYFSGVNTFANVATGTISVPTGLTATAGRYVLGGNLTIGLDTGYVITLQSTLDGFLLESEYFSTTTHGTITSIPTLQITESQISDLAHYTDTDTADYINASTTIPNLSCANGEVVKADGSGNWACASDNSSAGDGAFAWTPTTNYGTTANATNTPIWFQAGLQASSTSHFVNASTSRLTVSDILYADDIRSSSIIAQTPLSYIYLDDTSMIFSNDGEQYTFAGPNGSVSAQVFTSAISGTSKNFNFPNIDNGYFALGNYSTGFTNGFIPYGSSGLLATSSALTFDGTTFTTNYASTTAVSGTSVCIGTDCRTSWPTGGSGDFAWTPTAWGVSTSTTLGFGQGFISNASSTIASSLYLGSLGQGFLYTGTNGLVQPIASSSVQLSWFNNDSGFTTNTGTVTSIDTTWPITGGTITTTGTIGFDGLSTTTDSGLSQGLTYIGTGGILTSVSTSTALHLSISGNAGTATALASNGANCSSGNAPLGVDASGAVEDCFDVWTEAENTSASYIALTDLSATYPITYNNGTGAFTFGWTYPFPSGATSTPLTISYASTTAITASDAYITRLANLTSNGFVKTSGSNGTLSVDTNTYLTGNETITLSGEVSGSGATTITTTIADSVAVSNWNLTTPTLTSFFGTPCTGNQFLQDIGDTGTFSCATPTGGGGGDPAWATTSPYTGALVLYPADADNEDVVFGSNSGSTTTAPFWWDVSATTTYIGNGGTGDSFTQVGPSAFEWIFGFDDTDDSFAIASGTALGTNNALTIAKSTLNATFSAGLTVTGTLTGASGTWDAGGMDLAASDTYAINGTDVITSSGLGTGILSSSLTSVGTLTELNVDNLNFNLNTISSTAGTDLNITPLAGQQLVLDGTIIIDAGVITGISSMTIDTSGTLVVPVGTACDSNADGEICQDSSDNQLIVDGAVVPTTNVKIWSTTIGSTSPAFISEGLLKIPTLLDGYTMSAIRCSVQGGTSKVIAVEDESTNSTEDITCATSVTSDDGSITNATVTAAEEMYIDFGATSGAVDYVSISVFGNWTRE